MVYITVGEGKVGGRLDGTNSIEWVCSLLLMATCSSEIYVDMIFWLKLWVQFDMRFKLNTSWWFTTLVSRLWYVITFLSTHAELLLELVFLISMYKMSKGAYILSITKLYHCQWDLHIKKFSSTVVVHLILIIVESGFYFFLQCYRLEVHSWSNG